ncbi:MAG: amidohydrolase family protein [Armatimonadota bacterium]|nr:amidohydrolase family protein [Armatimonadota bacterium]
MFDMTVGCGTWAMRPTPPADPASLEAMLREEGVTGACAYPLEAWFWPDPHEANELRLPELAASDFFVPSAVINPTLAGWPKAYDLCRQQWQVPLVRLMPGYHAYDLDAASDLAERAAEDGVAVGVHLRAEDERMHNPVAMVPGVPFADVAAMAQRYPELQVIVFGLSRLRELSDFVPDDLMARLNSPERPSEMAALPENLWIELSFFEYESSLVTALKLFRADRLLFGTHAPLFYPRSNVLKIANSEADDDVKAAVSAANASTLLGVAP